MCTVPRQVLQSNQRTGNQSDALEKAGSGGPSERLLIAALSPDTSAILEGYCEDGSIVLLCFKQKVPLE